MIELRCRFCGWTSRFPDTPDYNVAAEDELSRHLEYLHGYISVLKHEYEMNNAVNAAYRRGEEQGRKMIREELTKIVVEALGGEKYEN